MHSAKFDNEKDSANILAAVQRYNITHPVVNDSDGTMWQNLGIPCWPTVLIIGNSWTCLFFTAVDPLSMNKVHIFVLHNICFISVIDVFFSGGTTLCRPWLPP